MRVEIDPGTATRVRQAFHLAADGERPLRTTLLLLTDLGLRSRRGKPLTLAALRKVLTNPFYAGWMPFQGGLYAGMHRPLIETEVFEEVQRNLGLPSTMNEEH